MKDKIKDFLKNQVEQDVLKILICGSVDDGKSTLIGRMLFEAKVIFEDEINALKNTAHSDQKNKENIDFSLLSDGLMEEREQKITIDLAYKYFRTQKRKFIIIDAPGHEQYTKNMITGASHADLALVLVDARKGILPQTKRHAFILSLLRVSAVLLVVNKMDLVSFKKNVFDKIVKDFLQLQKNFDFFNHVESIPISALLGDNVVKNTEKLSWYRGTTLFDYLEVFRPENENKDFPFRFPVQWVNRPHQDFRGYSGSVFYGDIQVGDKIQVLPSQTISKIKDIYLHNTLLKKAVKGLAVTITIEDNLDISRGSVMCSEKTPCQLSDQFQVHIIWLSKTSCYVGREYIFQIHTDICKCSLLTIKHTYNIENFLTLPAEEIHLNEIAFVEIKLNKKIPFDSYSKMAKMGGFTLVDSFTNDTVAIGMIDAPLSRAENIYLQAPQITKKDRIKQSGYQPICLWFTGLSGSGKSTIANGVELLLFRRGIRSYIIDGDNIRYGINKDLGFTERDRIENVRRVAEIANLFVEAAVFPIVALISPFKKDRDMARRLFKEKEFIEIFVNTPLQVAEDRDTKGLYKKARRGEIPNFTGVNSPYEPPVNPEITLSTTKNSVEECVKTIVDYLEEKKYIH